MADFSVRLTSVYLELNGSNGIPRSMLQTETGITVEKWKWYVHRIVDELADSFNLGPFSLGLIKDYAFVSAIYEWAAIGTHEEPLDALAFGHHRMGLYQEPSIGVFQGYPSEGAWALAQDASLRCFLLNDPLTQRFSWLETAWGYLRQRPVGGRVPGPEGGGYGVRSWSSFSPGDPWFIATNHFFSLIAKVTHSMRISQNVVNIIRNYTDPNWGRDYDELPPQLKDRGGRPTRQSSDPVSICMLAFYEMGDHSDREVRQSLDKMVFAVRNPGQRQTLEPIGDVERPRATFNILEIPYAETFHYDAQRREIVPQIWRG